MLSEPHTDHNNNNQRSNNGGGSYKQTRILQKNVPRSSKTDGTNNRNEGNYRANANNKDGSNGRSGNELKIVNGNGSTYDYDPSTKLGGLKYGRTSIFSTSTNINSRSTSTRSINSYQQQVKLVLGPSGQKWHLGGGFRKWSVTAAMAGSCRWNDKGGILLAVLLTSLLSFTTEVSCQVCGQPAIPLNAKVKTISGDNGITEARYECDTGYELFGPTMIKCDPKRGWERDLPFCGTNVAFRKPVNQSSYTRQGPAVYANDGKPGNQNPDGQECSETQKETSPWWKVDLITPQAVRVVRVTTRGCCGHQPLQDLEIRVGNSSIDLQRNPLCAWYPGTVDEGITKTFTCARPLVGQYVAIQLVGVEGSLSLCEVEVFTNEEFSPEKCEAPNSSPDTIIGVFSRVCYEFHVTRGESFEKAKQICRANGGNLIYDFRDSTNDYILSELERRKTELKTQLVWIGAQKEPGITSRTWKWVTGDLVMKPAWGKDQPNNYNGEQNCVVLDGGRNWLWNDVGCNLDYLHFICQHAPLSCGSPDSYQNTTIIGKNYTVGSEITYTCPKDHALIGEPTRTCTNEGVWSGVAPICKYVDCGPIRPIKDGLIKISGTATTYGVKAKYVCNSNFTLVGNETRVCELNGWSGDEPQCLIDFCPEPPSVVGGKVEVSGKRSGSTATYSCLPGYVLTGDPIISCGLGGEWTGKPPACRYVDCGAPPRPDHGSVMLLNESTTVGAMVKYQCEEDYWLVGPSEMSCTKEGKWSGETAVCELITCDTPHVPPGSYVVGYDYNIHSTIEYHCDPGHILRGAPILECMDSGEWSGDAPFCEFIDCGPLPPVPYGTHKYLQNTTFVGSEVAFNCAATHKLSGVTKRTCLETGLWSDLPPKCEEIRCPEPVLAPHSILSVTGNDRMYGRTLIKTAESAPSPTQTYKVGALAKYRCERGYKIVGEPLITCEDSGFWSGDVPECVYVECGNPPSIERGKVTLATNATYYGAAALYECNSNFKLHGVSRRLCLEDGTWSHETPDCREITCDEPETSEAIVVEPGIRSVGSEAKFSCMKGRYLVGSDTRICQKNGQWSGKSPTCKPVDCGQPLSIENGRVIVVNESTIYGGSAEYLCFHNFSRIGQFLRKCLEDGKWGGEEPRCERTVTDEQESSGLGTGIAIGATIIVVLLIAIGLIFLHRNKARPVKNTENVQAAESKEDRNASVMSYATLDGRARSELANPATFNTFHRPSHQRNRNINNNLRATENIYDQIPNEQFYDAPYEMRTNDEVYEPEPSGNMITINGISVR